MKLKKISEGNFVTDKSCAFHQHSIAFALNFLNSGPSASLDTLRSNGIMEE